MLKALYYSTIQIHEKASVCAIGSFQHKMVPSVLQSYSFLRYEREKFNSPSFGKLWVSSGSLYAFLVISYLKKVFLRIKRFKRIIRCRGKLLFLNTSRRAIKIFLTGLPWVENPYCKVSAYARELFCIFNNIPLQNQNQNQQNQSIPEWGLRFILMMILTS